MKTIEEIRDLMLSGNCTYRETHNALFDALDELEIIRLLGLGIHEYILL